MYRTRSKRLVKPPSYLDDYHWTGINLVVKFKVLYNEETYELEYPLNTSISDIIYDINYFFDLSLNKLVYNDQHLTVFRIENRKFVQNDLYQFGVKNHSVILGF